MTDTDHKPQYDAAVIDAAVIDAAVIDAVVIGRNEGARLEACLRSVLPVARRVVYVDSGSTDGSPDLARKLGATVIALDLRTPFTAARARNAGLDALRGDPPDLVQFVDGDCTVADGWTAAAQAYLHTTPEVAAVCGRRRERAPEASVYNLLCDWEWNTPVGETQACGGDAMIRFAALDSINGYRDDVIAAEDDEMCQRLRAAGWRIARIDAEMTLHDAAMARLGQFWRRAVRAGHGFAQLGVLHPGYFASERRRAVLWGAGVPLLALAGLVWSLWLMFAALALTGLSFARNAYRFRRNGLSSRHSMTAAALLLVSKPANLQGMATFHWRRFRGRAARIIEYK